MDYENFTFKTEGNIGIVTLSRPEKMNTLTPLFKEEFKKITEQIDADESVRVVVLTATGRAFCAGGDLDSAGEPKSILEIRTELREISNAMQRIQEMEKPWIAAVNGIAAGGGASLALACDFVICSENARFKYTFADIGIAPDSGGMRLLCKFMGISKAMEIAMTCGTVSAEEALKYGIALKLVSEKDLNDTLFGFAEIIASKPPAAIGFVKKLAYTALEVPADVFSDLEAAFVAIGTQTEDHQEGIKAFFEKRKPEFTGR